MLFFRSNVSIKISELKFRLAKGAHATNGEIKVYGEKSSSSSVPDPKPYRYTARQIKQTFLKDFFLLTFFLRILK
jgi:hypothetical protein